jgi:hypothetical protein
MHINWKEIAGAMALAWAGLQVWWAKFAPIIEPIVKEAEQMALDGTITCDKRKKFVMDAIAKFEDAGTIKMNFIERIIVGKIVDIIATRLPDFQVSKDVTDVMKQLLP